MTAIIIFCNCACVLKKTEQHLGNIFIHREQNNEFVPYATFCDILRDAIQTQNREIAITRLIIDLSMSFIMNMKSV